MNLDEIPSHQLELELLSRAMARTERQLDRATTTLRALRAKSLRQQAEWERQTKRYNLPHNEHSA